MKVQSIYSIFFLCLGILLSEWGCQANSSPTEKADAESLFVYEVLPLIESKCLSCHGEKPDELKGDFDMRTRKTLFAGGESGRIAVIPGQPGKSPLYLAANRENPDFAMPPKEGDALSKEDIEIFYDWIKGGAPWPSKARQEEILAEADWSKFSRIPVPTVGGLSENWTNRRYRIDDLWAFLPLEARAIPWEFATEQTDNPIDAFLNRKLKENKLKAASPADKRTLIRRATFDLTGLPPTETEILDFLNDDTPNAFGKVVERLLASPHYGEKWGRHWLDIVRYADSGGFSNDYIRPNVWRYRDYVIRSFNEDKPYDQFVLEQIAGDEINPEDPEMLVATGFLRLGPWEHTSMSIAAETRQFYLDDVTNIVGETFLSMPLNCAKCHDHKYDPIAAKDYYQVQAVFATTQFSERPAAFLAKEQIELSNSEKERIESWINSTKEEQKRMTEKEEEAAKSWFRKRNRKYQPKKLRRKLPDSQQPPRYYGLSHQELGYRKVLYKRLQTLSRFKDRFSPLAFSVYNGPNRVVNGHRSAKMPKEIGSAPPPTYILGGGSVYSPLESVDPGVLSALEMLKEGLDGGGRKAYDPIIPNTMNGRRLAFAKWITQADHPITSRSMVNRIWQYHFGTGIAGNPNNFGATGKKPTHPELLDWLAMYFVEHDWSIKDMHRLMMSSAAYQRTSQHPKAEKLNLVDPDNQWLAVYNSRRLSAEEIRDAMLFISGELNPELGGFPVRPEMNMELALQTRQIMGSVAQAYQPSRTPAERNRRSIYAERYRALADPILEVFNQPGTDLSCEERTESTVATQAFAQFNSLQTRNRAIALAHKLHQDYTNQEEQIKAVILSIWNRTAQTNEIHQAQEYLNKMTQYHQENKPATIEYPTRVKRKMMEEMTGEPFEYWEELDIYKDYTPDLQDKDVAPKVRALADFAVVLFNSNEFLYVY